LNITTHATAIADIITGGVGDDTIVSGNGADAFTTGGGTDTYTGGTGIDTITMSAVAGTLNFTGGGTATDVINAAAGVTNTVNILDATNITFTGNDNVDTYSGGSLADAITVSNAGAAAEADVITTGAGSDTIAVNGDVATGGITAIDGTTTKITDFTVGTDVLQLSATVGNYTNATNMSAGIGVAAAGATVVLAKAANSGATAVGTTDMIHLTTGQANDGTTTLQAAFNAAIGTGTVTGLAVNGDDIFFSVYDTTLSQALVGVVNTGGDNVVATGDVVSLVLSMDMTAGNYAAITNADLQIIA
jgi:hypothetical protein